MNKKCYWPIFLLLIVSFSITCFSQPAKIVLEKALFKQLPDWQNDNHVLALKAFQQSCLDILKHPSHSQMPSLLPHSSINSWKKICLAARKIHLSDASARKFFEDWFVPYHVSNNYHHVGLFTGYYLPLIQVSEKPNKRFHIPIHGLPKDLVKVDLGLFNSLLAGRYAIGQVKNNLLIPYPTREAIIKGKINHNAKILFWGDNATDVYFAQIQGSAMVQLPNKRKLLIGYAGGNGRAYTSIGKILIENNEISEENISMQSIREWLLNHPNKVNTLLNQNASYVFFRVLQNNNPLGTEQVPLTPERSLAIDTRYIPLGAPIWLNTVVPNKSNPRASTFRHLLIAQDTGGAIKGIVRGDIYWGEGDRAEFMAGHMNSPGEYWVLLPK